MSDKMIDPTNGPALLDALRRHPDTGLVIMFYVDDMKAHIEEATGMDPDTLSVERVQELSENFEWSLDFDYESLDYLSEA